MYTFIRWYSVTVDIYTKQKFFVYTNRFLSTFLTPTCFVIYNTILCIGGQNCIKYLLISINILIFQRFLRGKMMNNMVSLFSLFFSDCLDLLLAKFYAKTKNCRQQRIMNFTFLSLLYPIYTNNLFEKGKFKIMTLAYLI